MVCTLDTCPISASTYGYFPSIPANALFMAIFGLSLLLHLYQGIRWKAWSFLVALGVGCLMEFIGYYGRIRMHHDPFSRVNLGINIVCLTVAPAFISAGVYLTLKHLVIIFGPQLSRFSPRWYTRIFIACDILSILIQTAGAGLSASPTANTSLANTLMILGVVLQVVTLLIFGYLSVEYWLRLRRHKQNPHHQEPPNSNLYQQQRVPKSSHHSQPFHQATSSTSSSSPITTTPTPGLTASANTNPNLSRNINMRRIKHTIFAITIAYLTILIRCIYRVAEMAGGWRNPVMQDQAAFIALDSVMIAIAVLGLNGWHPGKGVFNVSREILEKEKMGARAGRRDEGLEIEMERVRK